MVFVLWKTVRHVKSRDPGNHNRGNVGYVCLYGYIFRINAAEKETFNGINIIWDVKHVSTDWA